MPERLVLVETSQGIATVTLNRPEAMNAVSSALSQAVTETFRELQADPEVRVVILTGAGRAFCAGMDLKELGSGGDASRGDKIGNPMDEAMRAFEGPIIAAVNGYAVTAGFEMALACDVIVASTQARFLDTHARVGILPGWGLAVKLSRLIGPSKAKSVSFTGNPISAEQAERWGLAARVVEPEALMPTCQALAEDMLSCDPETLRGYKRLIDDCYAMPLGEALPYETRIATESAQALGADVIAARRQGIQSRNRERTSDVEER
ncbi:MAG: enoyl-CoA hydratase [Myxococcales bacterium]|nr:enoyl-CoA hydratase [Myxococcales bacterium]